MNHHFPSIFSTRKKPVARAFEIRAVTLATYITVFANQST